MKKILILFTVLVTMLLSACGESKKEKIKEVKENVVKNFKVGLVLSPGGLGDKSFNDSAYAGLIKAEKELGVEVKYVVPNTQTEDLEFLRDFAENDYDLIIGIGFLMKDSLEGVAKEYPNEHFVLIDEPIDLPNVKTATFDEAEGSFIAGALAGMMTETNVIGFIGGMDMPLIKRFGNGYSAGAKYVNPKVKYFSAYVGGDHPFTDPAKGKEMALSMIDSKADVVYHAAAGSGMGVIEAAKERGVYAIGVDSDQDYVAPGVVLTSMVKKVDMSIFLIIKETIEKGFSAGRKTFDLSNGGVGITELKYTKEEIGKEKLKKLEQIKKDVMSGKIDVANEILELNK